MSETPEEKTQRLVNLLKERERLNREERKRRAEFKDQMTDVEDAIKELTVELDMTNASADSNIGTYKEEKN